MNILLTLFLISVLLFISGCSGQSELSEDIIKPVTLSAGEPDSVSIEDIYYASAYSPEFSSDPDLNIKYLPEEHLLVLGTDSLFEGLTSVLIKDKDKTMHLPVIVSRKQMQYFSYKPEGSPSLVNLFGSFNSWNRQQYPMQDNDGDGIYEIRVPIDPGRHEYKFFVDGKEIYDPVNPERISNGMGDFNSLVTVNPKFHGDFNLHLVSSEKSEGELSITFFLDNDDREIAFTKNNIHSFIGNRLLDTQYYSINGNYYTVSLPEDVTGSSYVFRTAAEQGGRVSNWQTIKIFNGEPAGIGSFRWNDAVIYSLMIDRFNDGDSSNSIPVQHPELSEKANYMGGDFIGILQKLEEGYFESLGINALWISPVIENTNEAFREHPAPHRYYTGYHGYWPVHATNVEERFGSFEDLKSIIETAHRKGIKVLLDYVAHHVHIEHPLWKSNPEWFGQLDLPDGRKNLRLWDEHRLTTWFEPYLPSFDFQSSNEALEYMSDNAVWWLKETGVDGFRHDAVKHIPNKFWRVLTNKIREQIEAPEEKDIYQIGETFGSYELVSSYVNNGQLDAQFNFILYDTAVPAFSDSTIPFRYLDEQLKRTFAVYGNNHLMGNVMDSHDKVRFMAYADGDITASTNSVELGWTNPPVVDDPSSYKKLQLYMAYMLSIPGIPIIYYGDEIGMSGAADPDNRRMMRFNEQLSAEEKANKEAVSRIINIRRSHPALRYGDFHTLHLEDDIYAYIRSDLNERILVLLNKGTEKKNITLQLPEYYNIKELKSLTGSKDIKVSSGRVELEPEPLTYYIYAAE